MPAGLLGTAQCQGAGHGGQDCVGESGYGRETAQTATLFTALSCPPPQAWGVPTSSAIFSSDAGPVLRSEHEGTPTGWPPQPQGKKQNSGTGLSIYCSANRGCWGLHPASALFTSPFLQSSPSLLPRPFQIDQMVLLWRVTIPAFASALFKCGLPLLGFADEENSQF